jgi:hypothetical protein
MEQLTLFQPAIDEIANNSYPAFRVPTDAIEQHHLVTQARVLCGINWQVFAKARSLTLRLRQG